MIGKTNPAYRSLTPDDIDHFLRKGWLKVPGAIKQEYIDKWMSDLWTRIDYDPLDKSSWKSEYLHLPRHREVAAEEFAPVAWAKTVELCGGLELIHPIRERYYGDAFICNFGSEETSKLQDIDPRNKKGWHTDDDWFRMFLDSSCTALTVIHCFTDIPKDAGGTWLCEDGIAGVVQYLYAHPEGLDIPTGHRQTSHIPSCNQFSTVLAKAGDVFLLHGLLPHAAGPNLIRQPRIIANPHVTLAQPYNLNRPDGNYSLLEQVILRGLNRESLPEFKITRDRQYWYPRNAGFKRAYAEKELGRMVLAAKEKGLPAESVGSIYQRQDTQDWKEYEARNGYDKPVHPLGNQMVQHPIGQFV